MMISSATDYAESNLRQAYLENLYELDGREYPKHPLHGRYTGLYQQRQQQLIREERDFLFLDSGCRPI